MTGSRKSLGCGDVKRMRSIPSTPSQARSSSPNSLPRSRPHELTFWPSSVISLTPSRCEPCHFGEDLARAARDLAAAHRGDDAVRALRIAPHRDLHPGLEPALAVHRQCRREPPLLRDPERAPLDAEPTGAEPLAQMRDRPRPERDVDLRIEGEEPLPLRFGVAAADGDYGVRASALLRDRVADVGRELRVRLLADRAGVEHDHVRLFARRRLAEPDVLEHALDPLAVVSVHLAAERRDEVPAHRQNRSRGLPELLGCGVVRGRVDRAAPDSGTCGALRRDAERRARALGGPGVGGRNPHRDVRAHRRARPSGSRL